MMTITDEWDKFAETGREEYLPQTAKDVFLF